MIRRRITRATIPAPLRHAANGQLPDDWLRDFDGRGALFVPVSYAAQALYLAAHVAGVPGFGPDDVSDPDARYRTLAAQDDLYLARHDCGRLLPGHISVAYPGESLHGLGIALDIAPESGTPADQLAWMDANAAGFGFGPGISDQPHHWHWIGGTELPALVVDVLAAADIDPVGFEPFDHLTGAAAR